MFTKQTILHATAAMCVAFSASAQSFDVKVTRNPAAGLAIYDFHFGAPSGSKVWLFGSLTILQKPLQIPGVFNLLELDPLHMVLVQGLIPVGPLGGQCQLALPMIPFENIEIAFQPVILDPNFNLALAPMATAVQGAAGRAAGSFAWGGGYSRDPNRYEVMFINGNPGDTVKVSVNGGKKGSSSTKADKDGKGTVKVDVTLAKGDTITITKNGVVVRKWTWK